MFQIRPAVALLIVAVFMATSAHAGEDERRADVRASAASVLASLYEAQPSARHAVEGAAGGHAVFSNFGLKILVAGGGTGKGLAVNHRTGQETFMKMVEVQAGLGFGAKRFGVVFVFEDEEALTRFIESGWEFGGQVVAAAKYGEQGAALEGAVSVSPGVWMYQITDKGLAAELVVKGTKYLKDGDLN